MSLRRQNIKKIMQAFELPDVYEARVDPLSDYNLLSTHADSNIHVFWVKSTPIAIPMSMFWQEIDPFELESLVLSWKLSYGDQLHEKSRFIPIRNLKSHTIFTKN